jgi:uncharacterized repeat protein (TIGR03837 family)
MLWDLFCRVVDNHGDVGVGWRLAADFAARGEAVRFWLDDPGALAWMAPTGANGVAVGNWADAARTTEPGDVVVEAFGCGLPAPFAERMAAQPHPPVWINLEYLSAEAFVERNHGLPSPRLQGPGTGLTQWFFYPGFTAATGGLLREAVLADRQRRFSSAAWLRSVDLGGRHPIRGDERIVSLFCYENPALPDLVDALAVEPTLLLVAAGPAVWTLEALLGPRLERNALRAVALPLLSQNDYDHLLWSSDLNFVRGEDSFVRAQWAASPFVWQIYAQADDVHLGKLDAFLDRFLDQAPPALALDVRRFFRAWNAASPWPPSLPELAPWRAHCAAWRAGLLEQGDLCGRLLGFVAERR